LFAKIQRIHFVGIGGIGMSGIAEVLINLGYKVSGSDLKASSVTERLAALGAKLFIGHDGKNVMEAEVVVASSAISSDNAEIAAAHALHVPIIQRAEMLAELMRLKYGIAVAGMHGKTTTTSMVAAVLAAGGLDPTVVVGGRVDAMGSNARLGKSQYLVAEADESDGSFLKLSPILSVVTNIDQEHLDYYRDLDHIREVFLEFMDRVPFYGMVVACYDDPVLRELLPLVRRRVVTYGTQPGADFRISGQHSELQPGLNHCVNTFRVNFKNRELGEFSLNVPGAHNVLNATAAIAVGIGLDVDPALIRSSLESFRGVDRRFQLRGSVAGISVVDDYGHHPTEIRATLAAARQCEYRAIHVIFQPHRYTRTKALMDDFTLAFAGAATVTVLDIYPASEQPIPGVTSEALVEKIRRVGGMECSYAASLPAAAECVAGLARSGDMVLTLGAGNVSQLGSLILEKLAEKDLAVSA
jgi:UDP-N-acetylmuramate--alanine ligase